MRFSSRLFLSVILLAALATSALAQKKTLCPKPPPSPYKHNGRIVTSIERAGARTTLEHPHALGGGAAAIRWGASFIHVDPRRAVSPTLELVLFSPAPGVRLDAGGLAFVYDGQPLNVGRNVSVRSQGGVQAALVALPYADVIKLTQARRVSARVGGAEYEFTHNHLEALRELVSQMAPSPGRWTADAGTSWTREE
jgi:hypothetical protein